MTQGTTITNTHYLAGGFQYRDTALQFFPHAEGYVNVIDSHGVNNYNYVFNYTDHLGNIRLSYGVDPSNGTLKIMEENHYYPFGLKHSGYNVTYKAYQKMLNEAIVIGVADPTTAAYQYKYNGKELQTELGLNMYDYSARNYDPALGRWMNIDPLAEKYYPLSPYVYALNNPMFFVDPDGNKVIIYYGQDGDRQEEYKYKKDRDYSEIKDSFLADSYRALDALYSASNIKIDGKEVNVLDNIINDERELSIAETENGSSFSYGRSYLNRKDTSGRSNNDIGTIYFNRTEGVLYDDVNDTSIQDLNNMKSSGKYSKNVKINSPTSVFGHEIAHAFNYATDKDAWKNRRRDKTTKKEAPYFSNREEAKATTLSAQINVNLKEHPRNNYNAIGVQTQGVLSNKQKK